MTSKQEQNDSPSSTKAEESPLSSAAAGKGDPELNVVEEEEDDDDVLLRNLVILSPRQTNNNTDIFIELPDLQASEPVQSLKQALGELVDWCHITHYHFVVEQTARPATNSRAVCYTGKSAVITVPSQSQNVPYDEYGTLGSFGVSSGDCLRMELLEYNPTALQVHLRKFTHLMNAVPYTERFVPERTTKSSTGTDVHDREEEEQEEDDRHELQHQPLTSDPKDSNKPLKLHDLKTYHSRVELVVSGTNLRDFYYLAAGEEPAQPKKSKKSKKMDPIKLYNELDTQCKLQQQVSVVYSAYHPPPRQRKLLGDLAYLRVTIQHEKETLHITACRLGFYVNKSTESLFDPAPSAEPCYAHSLLDCLLEYSTTFTQLWNTALRVAKERHELLSNMCPKPHSLFFKTALRSEHDGLSNAAAALQAISLDGTLLTPTWLVPELGKKYQNNDWTHNHWHIANEQMVQESLQNTFGLDVRGGPLRDWNEELQMAREMPTTTFPERLERARILHKVMTEFGEAALLGVQAIAEGNLIPMNVNEPARSQVFLFNNIFFSLAVDGGAETFKIIRGDRAARKAANREVQCLATLHRMEKGGLYTLNTVVIDYLGVRYVCQGVLPGILLGEKSHTLLYGSVEAGTPIKWDEELHKVFEERIGEAMMVATRPILQSPNTKERMEEINKAKEAAALEVAAVEESADPNAVVQTCVPMEAKGIRGSDQRTYVLDCSRLTPRDPNWLPKCKGGTGVFEKTGEVSSPFIPADLDDDEWAMNVLRSELISQFTRMKMIRHVQERRQKEVVAKKENGESVNGNKSADKAGTETKGSDEKAEGELTTDDGDEKISEDDIEYVKNLKLNVNVFLPHMRTFEGISEEYASQIHQDEELVREVGEYLWNEMLPRITGAVREGTIHQLPVDGKSLTEFLHRHGVNCRYLGRLAVLAKEQEDLDAKVTADLKAGKQFARLGRRMMPLCWLEMLECEMVARAAKHVLDGYLAENSGVASGQPAQTIASFLSAIVSEAEETAGQTELRLDRRGPNEPDDDDFGALTITGVGGGGHAVLKPIRGREEVWKDIESEIGRRFRYTLSLFNNGNKTGRALYIPLLRRVCQRTGVRLFAKQYDLGNKCLCGGSSTSGGRLILSYPISPLDISDVVPLMKHTAACGEGFGMCTVGPTVTLPPLQVSLQDARATLERAHIQHSGRNLAGALELAQESAALYQRVTENPSHPGIIDSIELMATILLEAGDAAAAASQCAKSLGQAIQALGFDNSTVYTLHVLLFKMYFASREMDSAVKHMRAAIYLLEIMSGPRHLDHYTSYHLLSSLYSADTCGGKYGSNALYCMEEASDRETSDRLADGFTAKSIVKILESMENYKDALEQEKRAFRLFNGFLGSENKMTKDSDEALRHLMKLAIEKGNKELQEQKTKASPTEEKKKISKKKKGKK